MLAKASPLRLDSKGEVALSEKRSLIRGKEVLYQNKKKHEIKYREMKALDNHDNVKIQEVTRIRYESGSIDSKSRSREQPSAEKSIYQDQGPLPKLNTRFAVDIDNMKNNVSRPHNTSQESQQSSLAKTSSVYKKYSRSMNNQALSALVEESERPSIINNRDAQKKKARVRHVSTTFTKDTSAGFDIKPAESDRSQLGFTQFGFVAAMNRKVKRLKFVKREVGGDHRLPGRILNQSDGGQWGFGKGSKTDQVSVTSPSQWDQNQTIDQPFKTVNRVIISQKNTEILLREEQIEIKMLGTELTPKKKNLDEILRDYKVPSFEMFVRDKMSGRMSKNKVEQVSRWIRLKAHQMSDVAQVNLSRVGNRGSGSSIAESTSDHKNKAGLSFKMTSNATKDKTKAAKKKFDFDLRFYQELYQARLGSLKRNIIDKSQSSYTQEEFFHTDDTLVFPLKDYRIKEKPKPLLNSAQSQEYSDWVVKKGIDTNSSSQNNHSSLISDSKILRKCKSCSDLDSPREGHFFPDLQVESDCYLMPVKIEVVSLKPGKRRF